MSASRPPPARADLPHPIFSRYYAAVSARLDKEGMAELRREMLTDARGTVVEVGAGNGCNFTHYPRTVTAVTAVEPEPRLRGMAGTAAATAPVPIDVVPGRAENLPLPDDSIDTAVLCLVICSLPDRAAALAEVARVLRPDGRMLFLEHTVAETPGLRTVQRIVDATIWPLLAAGCHTATDTLGAITAAGFEIDRFRRLRFPDSRFTQPATPHVLGSARPPVRAAG